ncbi:hypothetical protein [Enemella sp. A6]|uniref:hypothetical protein n=1 Tax=Enemella sp. A6 TaxID=3440152 RepID=UPI003EBDC07F
MSQPDLPERPARSEADFDREDIQALIETRRELGAEMEPALIDSFVTRIEEAAEQRARAQYEIELRRSSAINKARHAQLALAIVSLALAIPLTAIGADSLGMYGLVFTWAGIVAVNFAMALRRPPQP